MRLSAASIRLAPIEVQGAAGSHAPVHHAEDDDFVQAGALYA